MSTSMTLRPCMRRWEGLALLDGQALPHLRPHLISLVRPGTRTYRHMPWITRGEARMNGWTSEELSKIGTAE
jgi:hypothetical protein